MKVIAMYLPQFHKVKENDEWWGEGFTDWVASKQAQPLYEGHYQPHVPLGNNYYNLLDKRAMERQAELMHQYGVDGMCIYHYWFKDGRQILEKPAENLLGWKDIDMPYCFCWANETWARSWSNVGEKNVWADFFERERNGTGTLLEQQYGGEEEWRSHFAYLLPFFCDERYIKFEGKPVFVFYKADQIECLADMAEVWNRLAQENGLPGIYMIGSKTDKSTRDVVEAELHIEPSKTLKYVPVRLCSGIPVLDYDEVWRSILTELPMKSKTYFGGFVGFDDTPRRGKNGTVVMNAAPEKFGGYLAELMAKNAAYGMDAVFINAWNEWGEGMYLEPDEKDGYRYLEQIETAKKQYRKYVSYYKAQRDETLSKHVQIPLQERDKFALYLNLYDRWMSLHERNITLSQCLQKKGYRNIAVYGYGNLGKHFVAEAAQAGLTVSYVIDRQKARTDEGVCVYAPEDDLPRVDAVIISAEYYINEVRKTLRKKVSVPLISIGMLIKEAEEIMEAYTGSGKCDG